MQPPAKRFSVEDLRWLESFSPWSVVCERCKNRAEALPDWKQRIAKTTCLRCAAVYQTNFSEMNLVIHRPEVPLWFTSDFRGHTFYALNAEHLSYLEDVIANPLRERPKQNGRRLSFTTAMPFNLPAWMLSASNRDDLLKLIAKLKQRTK